MALGVDASDGPLKFDAIGRPHAVIEPHSGTRAVDLPSLRAWTAMQVG